MYTTLHCIALRTIRHTDSRLILSAWSREAGRVSIALSATATRESRRRRALTSPLSLFECVCSPRPGQEILTVRDLAALPGSMAMNTDPSKHFTSEFLAEILDLVLRGVPAEERLSDFLLSSVRALAEAPRRRVPNFHIILMSGLARELGFAPDAGDYFAGAVFDLREGCFRASAPLHPDYVEGIDARIASVLCRAEQRHGALLPLDRSSRRRALHLLLLYYGIHHTRLEALKSPGVLEQMF